MPRATVSVLTRLDSAPLTLFFVVLFVRDPTWRSALLVAGAAWTGSTLRELTSARVSLRNISAANVFVQESHFPITEIDDPRALIGDQAFAELYWAGRRGPQIRLFSLHVNKLLQGDATFTNHAGPSYIFLLNDLADPGQPMTRLRVLHEAGHVSRAAMRVTGQEYAMPFQLVVLWALMASFQTSHMTSRVIFIAVTAYAMVMAWPLGPNRQFDAREMLADRFAIAHMDPDSARKAVELARALPLGRQVHKLRQARRNQDYGEAVKWAEPFAKHDDAKLLDLLRPSHYLRHNPEWLLSYQINVRLAQLAAARSAVELRRRGELEPDFSIFSSQVRSPGWWSVQPFATIPLVVVFALQAAPASWTLWWFLICAPLAIGLASMTVIAKTKIMEMNFNKLLLAHDDAEIRAALDLPNDLFRYDSERDDADVVESDMDGVHESWRETALVLAPAFTGFAIAFGEVNDISLFANRPQLSLIASILICLAFPPAVYALKRSRRHLYVAGCIAFVMLTLLVAAGVIGA